MFLIWHGKGIVVPVLSFGMLLAGQFAVDNLIHPGYWRTHDWPLVAAGGMTALLLWFLGRIVNSNLDEQWVDQFSGLELVYRPPRHSFFFLPIEWAGLVFGLSTLLSLLN